MKKITTVIWVALLFFTYSAAHAQCTLACYSDVNISLDASGHATISAETVLASYGPVCGTLVVEPSAFDCSDIGAPVPFTVTDLGSGNACTGNIHVSYPVGAMSCYADINVALGPSGTAALTSDMLLFDPPGVCIPGAIISPSSVSCADIGAPVVVTISDPVSGNSCWTNVQVSYAVGAMSCYADINLNLGSSGTLALTPEMILFDPPGACIPGAIISPSSVSCADIDAPVVVTITDPVSGNSCWSTVTVGDPRPSSCEIIVPDPIICGDSGVPFSILTTGGYGPFEYNWQIKGNPRGWSILTGQGTDNITMAVGDRKIKLEVTITDLCGKKRKCSVKPECEDPPAFGNTAPIGSLPTSQNTSDFDLEIFPNPATHNLWIKYPKSVTAKEDQLYIVDQLGRLQTQVSFQQTHDGATLNIQDLQPGVYWLVLENKGGEPLIRKFIKQ